MRICNLIIIFAFFPFFINAQEILSESELFEKFKIRNSCWYNTENKMVEESEKIIDFQKKFNLEVKSNTQEFWNQVTNKIKIRYPDFDFSKCNEQINLNEEETMLSKLMADTWEANNPWFGVETDMTSFAIDVHLEIVESGIDPDSQTYYDMLDEKMREQFPDYFNNVTTQSDTENTSEELDDKYYTLTVDGNSLIFDGDIEAGLYYDFKDILKINPSVNKLILKSYGGTEEEALDVADIIIDYGLDTHAFNCESSCTILFAAGENRTLQRGYKLGFHRTYWSASSLETYYEYYKDDYDGVFDFTSWVYDDTQDTLFKKFQYFIERGVDPLFIIKTLKAKSDGMWHPRRKELRDANFITQ